MSTTASTANIAQLSQRQQYYDRIAHDHMTPLWEVLGALVPKQPTSPA